MVALDKPIGCRRGGKTAQDGGAAIVVVVGLGLESCSSIGPVGFVVTAEKETRSKARLCTYML